MTKPQQPKGLLLSPRTGHVVCKACRRGYGSQFDGLCTACRPKGLTAHEARMRQFDEATK